MKRFKKLLKIKMIFVTLLFLFLVVGGVKFYYDYSNNIDRLLKTNEYSYLPVEAKNFINEVYEETGEVVLTEKNKEENVPYLNPQYVTYLQLSDEEKANISLIPNPYKIDYVFSDISSDQEFPSSYNLENVDGKNYGN